METPPSTPAPSAATGWGPLSRTALRFFFLYMLLYSLPLILRFPLGLASSITSQVSALTGESYPSVYEGMTYLAYPGNWFQGLMHQFTPWVSYNLLGVDVEPPARFTGSGDGLYPYCTSFAYLFLAVVATAAWTAVSAAWRRWRTGRAPNYDRLHALFRLVVRFHLMYQMLVYGAMKVWCGQFPPISDGQLEARYGDSSPMGLLWRFMQFSQPYTSATGIVEFTCGLLLISRRTTLLGALCSAGATLQVFLLNMCYDVPVKLMSGHLLVMSLLLIAPDAKRLFSFFVLGRPVAPAPLVPLFGRWKWLNRAGLALSQGLFLTYAAAMLNQAYQDAKTNGILAPEKPALGRWIGEEFWRDGEKVPFPEQPDNPPPRQVTPPKWKGGPGMPAVVRLAVSPRNVVVMFEDGTGTGYRNLSAGESELTLASVQDGRRVAELQVSFPDPDVMVAEGPFDGQKVKMTLRRPITPKKEYLLRNRGFRWVQEEPFNR